MGGTGVISLESEEEEEPVEVVVRAPEPGHRCTPINLDNVKDEEMVHATVARAPELGHHRSKRLQGHRS